MQILVTGASGFVGRHVVQELIHNHIVYTPAHTALNLLDKQDVSHYFNTIHPEVVIHLAAKVGGIGANYQHPADFIFENLQMGLNVIDACRKYKVNKLVNISTVCSYPKFCPIPFKETDLWNGYPEETNAPYGIAKKTLMETCRAFRAQYDCNFITLIPVNLYGPGDNFHPESSHAIPALIRKIHLAKQGKLSHVTIWGTGKASREFLFVRDAARAIHLATLKYNSGEPINLGSGQEIKIVDLVILLKKLMGYEGDIVFDDTKPDGQPRRCLDISRMKQALDFVPTTSLRDGLLETIRYFEGTQYEAYI